MTEVISINQTELAHENSIFANLAASLTEIRKLKGVLGYILRSATSAIVDLPGKDTVCQYAILSAQMHEACLEVSQLFDLGQPESLIVEGKTAKLLCLTVGENKISVFMEKDASHAWILRRVML